MSTAKHVILVVEDERAEREALARVLRLHDYNAVTAVDVADALEWIEKTVDVVVSDLRLGKESGVDLLRFWKDRHSTTPFILVTAYGDVESAVSAMKLGAEDYLTKPVDPEQLLDVLHRCLERRARTIARRPGFEKIVAQSNTMMDIFERTDRAARTESTVLVVGESGTGKELIAEAIHQKSPRNAGPFVTVNITAIPETLIESELFGHVKGAFTNAVTDRLGCFQRADGGTLFIDEIGDFELTSQAKLLRALENGTVLPVGSDAEEDVDVRVIAATSRNLHDMLREGTFREDLFYRLNVVTIQLPPLRERREDIRPLADAFLTEFCEQQGRPLLKIDADLLNFLESFDWPGNVRQLRNCIESMVVMAHRDVLPLADLPQHLEPPLADDEDIYVPKDTSLEDLEREAIRQTLGRYQGNRTRAAKALGISVRTLQRRIKQWRLDEDE